MIYLKVLGLGLVVDLISRIDHILNQHHLLFDVEENLRDGIIFWWVLLASMSIVLSFFKISATV